jgi:hypothetical protein
MHRGADRQAASYVSSSIFSQTTKQDPETGNGDREQDGANKDGDPIACPQ